MTSTRWAKLLRAEGFSVQHTSGKPKSTAQVLIGLHAVASRDLLLRWRGGPRIAVVTGTDLRGADRDLAMDTLRQVEAVVVLQPLDRLELESELIQKTRVILPSVILPAGLIWSGQKSTTACCVGHLRAVKNPLALPQALALAPNWTGIHLGDQLEEGWDERLQHFERFRWLGAKTRGQTLGQMSRAGCFVIPSFAEGCSNALCEAVALGMPILASDIPGNRGLLGEEFGGYFPAADHQALAARLNGPRHFPSQKLRARLRPARESKELAGLVRCVLTGY